MKPSLRQRAGNELASATEARPREDGEGRRELRGLGQVSRLESSATGLGTPACSERTEMGNRGESQEVGGVMKLKTVEFKQGAMVPRELSGHYVRAEVAEGFLALADDYQRLFLSVMNNAKAESLKLDGQKWVEAKEAENATNEDQPSTPRVNSMAWKMGMDMEVVLASDARALERRLNELREALAFYANKYNWITAKWDDGSDTQHAIPIVLEKHDGGHVALCDCGDIARKALRGNG